MNEIITPLQCEKARESCYRNNIQPILSELEKMNKKLDSVMPVAQEVNDFRTFFRIGRQIGIGTAIFITTTGIIVGGFYAIRDWLKK